MENVSTRTLTIHPPGDWFAAAGALVRRFHSAMRAFGEALQKEPVRGRAKARRRMAAGRAAPRPSPWKEPGELPETYGRTRVVAMVVSPYLVHVYWDLSPKDRALGGPACLRFHDTTAGGSFDVNVDLAAANWYVHLWSPEKRYLIELGLQRADAFTLLARSNPIETPRAWPVAEVTQVSDQPVPRTPAPAGQVFDQSIRPVSIPQTTAPAPKSAVSEDPALPVQPSPPPPPVNALETLRRRLSELYGFRRWPRPLTPLESAAIEESIAALPEIANSQAPPDVTARLETQFAPGLSSGLLQNRTKPSG